MKSIASMKSPLVSQIFTIAQILTLTQIFTHFWPHQNVTIMSEERIFYFLLQFFWMKSAPVFNTRYRRKVVLSMNKVPFITKAKNLSWSSWWDIFAGYPRLAIDSFFSRFKEKSSMEVTKIKAQQWPDFSFSTTLKFRILSKKKEIQIVKTEFSTHNFPCCLCKEFFWYGYVQNLFQSNSGHDYYHDV